MVRVLVRTVDQIDISNFKDIVLAVDVDRQTFVTFKDRVVDDGQNRRLRRRSAERNEQFAVEIVHGQIKALGAGVVSSGNSECDRTCSAIAEDVVHVSNRCSAGDL